MHKEANLLNMIRLNWAVFRVRFLSELSSIVLNGMERNPLSTVDMSQAGVPLILAGLALK